VVHLVSVWYVLALSAGVERGAYGPEAASGVLFAALLTWALTLGLIVLAVGLHPVVWLFRSGSWLAAVRGSLPRLGVELAVAAPLCLVFVRGAHVPTPFRWALVAGATASKALLLHLTANTVRAVRG